MPKFTLYKKYKNGESEEWNKVGEEITLTRGGTEGRFTYTGSFSRIDDGEYKLVETHTPAGYNTAADTLFTITADHEVLSDNPALTSLKINQIDGDKTKGTVQADVVNKKALTSRPPVAWAPCCCTWLASPCSCLLARPW